MKSPLRCLRIFRSGTERILGAVKIKPYHLPTVLVFFIAAMILTSLSGCREPAAEAERSIPAVAVAVADVERTTMEYTSLTTGVVEPWKRAALSFEVAGRIVDLAEAGQTGNYGTALGRLDDTSYRLQVEAARHQLTLSGVEYDQARADLERYEQLFAAEAISMKIIEDARYRFQAADIGRKQAETALQQAEVALAHTVLGPPFPGTVLQTWRQPGEVVAAGIPVLELAQLQPVRVVFSVPAAELTDWPVGTKVAVFLPETDDRNQGREGGGRGDEAAVHQISPGAADRTGLFKVELKVANPGAILRSGQVVNVEQRMKTAASLWVPLKAVVSRGEELKYVFVLQSGEDRDVVRQRQVSPGAVVGEYVEIIEGLDEGERIVVPVPENLRDGDRVEVRTP